MTQLILIGLIRRIVIYAADSTIQPLNGRGLERKKSVHMWSELEKRLLYRQEVPITFNLMLLKLINRVGSTSSFTDIHKNFKICRYAFAE